MVEHRHHDHGHAHDHRHHAASGHRQVRALLLAVGLTLGFAAVETLFGMIAHSLALISDAGHMLSDAAALALALTARWLSARPPSGRHSYGLVRAEFIAASINGMVLLGITVWICIEAFQRLQSPPPVSGAAVMLVAVVGLAVNLLLMRAVAGAGHDLNTRAAMLHVLGDLLGSVAALVAGAVVYFTGWLPIDPLLSLVVAGLILASTVNLLREAVHVLMEGVPHGIDLADVGMDMARLPGVLAVHDLHVWTLSSGKTALSAHVEVRQLDTWPVLLRQARLMLAERFEIEHVTIQPELVPELRPRDGKVIPIRERPKRS